MTQHKMTKCEITEVGKNTPMTACDARGQKSLRFFVTAQKNHHNTH